MRAILPGDLERCAIALLAMPPVERPLVMGRILSDADLADRYRKRLGRVHPTLGDGSLTSAARRQGRSARPARCDPRFCACLSVVLDGIAAWRARAVTVR